MKKSSASFLLLLALLFSLNVFSVPVLNSLPSANATIYLDFNGHNVNSAFWNGGAPFTCDSSGLTDVQITEVFNRVAEDYRPFDINITTDEVTFLAAPLSKRIRIIVTTTSGWYAGVGGVAFIGSFTWGDDTPAFVFTDRLGPKSPKMVAECCSHESGHSVGLSHQSKYDGTCNLTSTYHEGAGTGDISWAPIMGNSYYRNMSGWNNGPTPYGCANTQDNLSIITTQNGFTYRADDYGSDLNNTFSLNAAGFNVDGIISTSSDKDAFSFTLANKATVQIAIKPFGIDANYKGANLDVKMLLYNAAKELIRTYDPEDVMDVKADTLLNAGTYYFMVDGTGNSNVDDYGSLGSYSISSAIVQVLPITSITLSGTIEKNSHLLNWDITSEEALNKIMVETSLDGVQFNLINNSSVLANKFTNIPFQQADCYYRIKVVSNSNRTLYSNVIKLAAVSRPLKKFTVSSFIQSEIRLTAYDNYQYVINDVNGKAISNGRGKAGINRLDMGYLPNGIYILQLLGNNQRQTERIIKQ